MRHSRILILAIAIIFNFQLSTFNSLQAQITHTATGVVDETANALLKKAADKMKGTVSFTITVVNYDADHKETFRQKADILYKAPKYRVKSGDLEIYCDGKSVWQLNSSAKEVVVTNMTDSDDDLTNPAKLLANYAKNYRPKFIREDEDGTAVVDLQPKKARQYHKLRLLINAKSGALKKIEQHNYDSTRGEYVVTNFKGAKASDSDFSYTATPGIEVVDMR